LKMLEDVLTTQKPTSEELEQSIQKREKKNYFSLRARRFRIIYMVKESTKTIEIHYVGHRKDIYELFKGQFIK